MCVTSSTTANNEARKKGHRFQNSKKKKMFATKPKLNWLLVTERYIFGVSFVAKKRKKKKQTSEKWAQNIDIEIEIFRNWWEFLVFYQDKNCFVWTWSNFGTLNEMSEIR